MKTFDEKDLITWSNRDKAVIGNKYYFANIVDEIYDRIRDNDICTLIEILDENVSAPFIEPLGNYDGFGCGSACILPVDKVIDEPEKKYRACETIKEFYELVSNSQCKVSDEEFIYHLIRDCIIHYRQKESEAERYEIITSVVKYNNGDVSVDLNGTQYNFSVLFENYELDIDGEWQPFGVLDDN